MISLEARSLYDYMLDVIVIRCPIVLAVKGNGWEWVPVRAKRYAKYYRWSD